MLVLEGVLVLECMLVLEGVLVLECVVQQWISHLLNACTVQVRVSCEEKHRYW